LGAAGAGTHTETFDHERESDRHSGPIAEVVLRNVRRNNRGLPVDTAELNRYIESQGGPANYLKTPFPSYLDNMVLHPMQPNWIINGAALGNTGAPLRSVWRRC